MLKLLLFLQFGDNTKRNLGLEVALDITLELPETICEMPFCRSSKIDLALSMTIDAEYLQLAFNTTGPIAFGLGNGERVRQGSCTSLSLGAETSMGMFRFTLGTIYAKAVSDRKVW